MKVHLVGLVRSEHFHRARTILSVVSAEVTVAPLLEVDWHCYQQRQFGELKPDQMCCWWMNGKVHWRVDLLAAWAATHYGFTEATSSHEYRERAEQAYLAQLKQSQNKYLQWQVSVGGAPAQRLVFELDFRRCPRTSDNFWQLSVVTRKYCFTQLHRVVRGAFLEGGVINNSVDSSAFGEPFADENYSLSHDKPGVLGMSKVQGRLNGSVFYVTFRPLPHLNGRSVAFGRVVEGSTLLKQIESLGSSYQQPVQSCTVVDCMDYLQSLVLANPTVDRPLSAHTADWQTVVQRRHSALERLTHSKTGQQVAFRSVLTELISAD